jgi:hypothetical protein
MTGRRARTAVALLLAVAAALACGGPSGRGAASSPPSAAARPDLALPSLAGINYDGPAGEDEQWLGTRWLRAGDEGWSAARPRLHADLDFIAAHRLGRVVRLFIGLDQLMARQPDGGFVRLDEAAAGHLAEAFDMFDAHRLTVIAVVFDQEETGSPGNFRFEALDGRHAAMRAGYLRATDEFFRRFGGRATVAGWDLFNEAYNSLGAEGGLHRPPADDPVSPNYPDDVVHAWIRDLYRTARAAAPSAWLTVSDATELYRDHPDPAKYDGAVDFYDIHVYDDSPTARDWAGALRRPYLLGEVGGDIDHGFRDPSTNARAVGFWLSHARGLGIRAVLAHAADCAVFCTENGTVTPTGALLEASQ